MPRRSLSARLWLQPARRNRDGKIIEKAVWVIRDGRHKRSTGYRPEDCANAADPRLQLALGSESVADFRRNHWPACVGISGGLPSEYAARPCD